MNRFHRWYCGTGLWAREISRVASWALQDCQLGPDALEIGPGRGHTTALLRRRVDHLTTVEIDPGLADGVRTRFASATNLEVVTADATSLPFEDQRFSGATCFTMLHHVASVGSQDRLLAEAYRVLRPGATFAGSDSTETVLFRLAHLRDTMVLVDPATFAARLESAGFVDVMVDVGERAFRFRGRRPASATG
jgi:ubiquinone/menaquinone biosynthesis C-methylase UbiE